MYILTSVATDNILASYASRFQRDPNGDGYRFIADDYGDGVACSADQRDAYVAEFTQFVKRRTRFQYLWMFGLVVFTVVFLIISTFWWEWQPVINFMERDDSSFPLLGVAFIVLPLIPTFWQGYHLYQQPVVELCKGRVATDRRRSNREIMNRRISGMSDMMIGLMIIVPLAGLIISWLEINGGQRTVATLGGFGAMFVIGCVLAAWKHIQK